MSDVVVRVIRKGEWIGLNSIRLVEGYPFTDKVVKMVFEENPHEKHRSYIDMSYADGTHSYLYDFEEVFFVEDKGEEIE